jgi:hypothetical protein
MCSNKIYFEQAIAIQNIQIKANSNDTKTGFVCFANFVLTAQGFSAVNLWCAGAGILCGVYEQCCCSFIVQHDQAALITDAELIFIRGTHTASERNFRVRPFSSQRRVADLTFQRRSLTYFCPRTPKQKGSELVLLFPEAGLALW